MSYGRRPPIGSAAREKDDQRRAELRRLTKQPAACTCGASAAAILERCTACRRDEMRRRAKDAWFHKGSVQ